MSLDPQILAATPPFTPRDHVMIDLETLGTRPGSVILSLGAVTFGVHGLAGTFYRVIYVKSSEDAGLIIDNDTLTWWGVQTGEVQQILEAAYHGPKQSIYLGEALHEFSNWLARLGKDYCVWGNGADFDLPILAEAYRRCGLAVPWRHTNTRCYRTLKNLRSDIPLERIGEHHNALDDAQSQAMHAGMILTTLCGREW